MNANRHNFETVQDSISVSINH